MIDASQVIFSIDPGELVRANIIRAECGVSMPDGGECGRTLWVTRWTAAYGTYAACQTHGEVLLPSRMSVPRGNDTQGDQ